jgi:release factor glutamine methyltransferase
MPATDAHDVSPAGSARLSGMSTIRSTLQDGTGRLPGDDARREAEILLAHVLDASRASLIAHTGGAIGESQRAAFDALIERRARGEPVAYLTGTRGFHSLELRVTRDVLIPRPETELLVELALARMLASSPDEAERNPRLRATSSTDCAAARLHSGYAAVDLGTGSGAIALAIARARPDARVLATDASEAALAVARDNAQRLHLTNVDFRQGDWCASLGDARFDLIVSNPPYIAEHDPHLREGDLRFEPRGALASGPDGLDAIRSIVRDVPTHLRPGGWLMFEHGFEQGPAARELLMAHDYTGVFTERDLAGCERVSGGRVSR